MKETAEIWFETVLRAGPVEITDVCQRDNITYFKVNGHQFQTYDHKVHHRGSPLFDSGWVKFDADRTHEPEAIIREEKMMDEINIETDLWWKHRTSVLLILFPLACKILAEKGEAEFVKFVDEHLFITAEEPTRKIIERLEKPCP